MAASLFAGPMTNAAAGGVTVLKSGSATGTVTDNMGAIDCGAVCSASYANGTVLTLSATPGAGNLFTGWLGACTGTGPCSLTIDDSNTLIATFAPDGPLNLNIDADGEYRAVTDGVLVLRYLFGVSGAQLVDGATALNAPRSDSAQISTYLTNLKPLLDIDGDGNSDALTDGLLIVRYLLGLRGDPLPAGAIASGAIRIGSVDIETQIASLIGTRQSISFTSTAPAAAKVTGATYHATATATSALPVTLTIDAASNSVCSIASGTVSFNGVGTCTINADQPGNATYAAALRVKQSFPVTQGTANGGNFYTTTFSATENPLSEGGKWINGQTTGIDWLNVASIPGLAYPPSGNPTQYNDSTAVLAGTWAPDQYVRTVVRFPTIDTQYAQEVEIRLRTTIAPHSITGYEVIGGTQIVRWNGPQGDFVVLSDEGPYASLQDGDVFEARIVDNVITVYINGVQVNRVVDNTYSSGGSPGIGLFTRNPMPAPYGFSSFTAANDPIVP